MIQLSATRCSCIAILWVSLVSFAAITLCVASQRVFTVIVVYFVIDSVSPETFRYTLVIRGVVATCIRSSCAVCRTLRFLYNSFAFSITKLVPSLCWPCMYCCVTHVMVSFVTCLCLRVRFCFISVKQTQQKQLRKSHCEIWGLHGDEDSEKFRIWKQFKHTRVYPKVSGLSR
jgi:hypothetical protein